MRCRPSGLMMARGDLAVEYEGIRSRAEILDAAVAAGAQGILLNNGPHQVDAVRLLAKIAAYFFFS